MAYPFQPAITLREFLERARHFGVTLEVTVEPVIGPRGPVYYRYLIREGGVSFAVLPEMGDDEPITPDVLRSLCDQLALPKEEFGLPLE